MPRAKREPSASSPWRQRVGSPTFDRRLRALFEEELHRLGQRRLKEVVHPTAVRRRLQQWTKEAFANDVFADVVIDANRRLGSRMRRERRSLREILGGAVSDDVDSLLESLTTLPSSAQDLFERLLREEFVRRMLTDLIFTAIEAFNRRVNPLFGAMTTRMLEDQIKSFIGLFMPTLQRQAVAFASSRTNQRLALDLLRAVVRSAGTEPLSRYAIDLSDEARDRVEAALRRALRSRSVAATAATAVANAWDDVWAEIGKRRVADLVDLDRLAGAAAGLTAAALAALPAVAELVADEIAAARADGEADTRARVRRSPGSP